MIRALMVDVDGVLIDSRPAGGKSWGAALKAELGLDMAAFRQAFFARYWDDILIGRRDLRPCMTEALARVAPSVTCDQLIGFWFGLDARVDVALRAALGQQRAAGTAVYLATNNEHLRARHLMEAVGLRDEVDGILYSAALGCRKPQREFFVAAARQAGHPPGALMLIDDLAENVEGARRAGWQAVLWERGMRLEDVLPPTGQGQGRDGRVRQSDENPADDGGRR